MPEQAFDDEQNRTGGRSGNQRTNDSPRTLSSGPKRPRTGLSAGNRHRELDRAIHIGPARMRTPDLWARL